MDNIEEVKRLQDGFGGWADHMSKVGQLSASECVVRWLTARDAHHGPSKMGLDRLNIVRVYVHVL